MEKRISNSMEKFGLTYMELLRKVAVTCDEFILFVREKTYSQNMADWPNKCGDVFYDFPILSSFGTCFMTNIENNLTWVEHLDFKYRYFQLIFLSNNYIIEHSLINSMIKHLFALHLL